MRIRPSKLSQLALCPKMDMVENEEVTSLGTLIHEACATGNVTGLSDEDKQVVEGALAFAESLKMTLKAPVVDEVEEEVYCRSLDLKGTVDRLLIGADGTALVIDWKTGPAGLPDDADDSLQVQAYMLGVLDKYPNVHTTLGTLTNPRTQSLSADIRIDRESMVPVVSRIRKIIERAEHPFAAPCIGSHCAKCRHAACCWALVPTVKAVASPMLPGLLELLRDPETATPTRELRSARAVVRMVLERWCDAVKDADNEDLKSGSEPPPGFKRMIRSTGLRVPEAERYTALQALRAAGIDDSVIAAGCNLALGKMIDAQTLVLGDKRVAAQQVQGALKGIAVEGTTEYMARDRKSVDDASLFAMLRGALGTQMTEETMRLAAGKGGVG